MIQNTNKYLSPNANLVPLERAWRVCRTLMADCPRLTDSVNFGTRSAEIHRYFGELPADSWIHFKQPDDSNWYVKQTSEGLGLSRKDLPDDEKVELLIEVEDLYLKEELERFLTGLGLGVHYEDVFLEGYINFNPLAFTKPYSYQYPREEAQKIVNRIVRVIEAYDKNYNTDRLYQFRKEMIIRLSEILPPGLLGNFNYCGPRDVDAFISQLKRERYAYFVDGFLYSSIKGSQDLSTLYAANTTQLEGFEQSILIDENFLKRYNKIIQPLIAFDIDTPEMAFANIVSVLSDEGEYPILNIFRQKYQELMNQNIELGQNSESLDIHLDYLFIAMNYVNPLLILSSNIIESDKCDTRTKKLYQRLDRTFQEKRAKIMHALNNQIRDFNGDVWNLHMHEIELAGKDQKKIDALLKENTEVHFLYPRKVGEKMIEDALRSA